MDAIEFIMAVDGGGSTSDVALYNPEGCIVKNTLVGPLSCKSSTRRHVLASLRDLRRSIEGEAKWITCAVLGLSGLDTEDDFSNMQELLKEAKLCKDDASLRKIGLGRRIMSKWGFPIILCSDAILPLFANGATHGAVVISGTGSIALNVSAKGSIERFGGWGYRVSDEGSGTWIGTSFIREALHACDRLLSRSGDFPAATKAQRRLIEEAYSATCASSRKKAASIDDKARGIRQWAMSNDDPKAFTALARTVIESKGAICKGICEEAQTLLATLAVEACDEDTGTIVLSGGTFKNGRFALGVSRKIAEMAPGRNVGIIVNSLPPSDGAYEIARHIGARRKVAVPKASSNAVRKSMQGNKGSDTKPELLVRQRLTQAGLTGYRLHWKVPGKPDISWPGKKVCIFINGCFWHRHEGCSLSSTPKSNVEYWTAKFDRNVERDEQNRLSLEKDGWKVYTIWECELAKDRIDETFESLVPLLAEDLGRD